MLKVLRNAGIGVNCFLDKMVSTNTSVDGIPVFRPDSVELPLNDRREMVVITTIFNPSVDMVSLYSELNGLGYKNLVSFPELHRDFSSELGDRFWLTDRSIYKRYSNELQAVVDLLEDEKSRYLFEKILFFRAIGQYDILPDPDLVGQYFPRDLPPWESPLRLVDCGACIGDTIEEARKAGIKLESVFAFEPDQDNFARLTEELSKIGTEIQACLAWPCGVSIKTSQLQFDGGKGAGSSISKEGSQIIQCVSLDKALIKFEPNLIKMDIEGSECDAILGAQAIIENYRPGLAICLYHRPQHLWEIPLLVKKITRNGGRYFIRCHRYSGFDLVLYWMP